jgi:hypothetical protein
MGERVKLELAHQTNYHEGWLSVDGKMARPDVIDCEKEFKSSGIQN